MSADGPDLDALLAAARGGDDAAAAQIFDHAYDELRAIAHKVFRDQMAAHTLQPTVLVHEAWMRMNKPGVELGQDTTHFLAIAARAMRQVLVNHARDRKAAKRGGGRKRESLAMTQPSGASMAPSLDILAMHEAIKQLEERDPRQAKVAELRLFGGLSNEKVAEVVGVSLRTVEQDWREAKTWIGTRLADGEAGP